MQFIDIHTHSINRSVDILSIVNKYPDSTSFNTPFSIGIHPWYISEEKLTNDLLVVEKRLQNTNCYALGECGLDKLTDVNFQLQIDVFKKQIVLSEKHQKPIIIHCVRSFQEIIQLKKELKPKQPWVIHGFNKNIQIAQDLIKHNFSLSIGASLLKNEKLQQTVSKTPIPFLFLETDNSDEDIENIYKKIAKIKDEELIVIKEQMNQNFNRIFI